MAAPCIFQVVLAEGSKNPQHQNDQFTVAMVPKLPATCTFAVSADPADVFEVVGTGAEGTATIKALKDNPTGKVCITMRCEQPACGPTPQCLNIPAPVPLPAPPVPLPTPPVHLPTPPVRNEMGAAAQSYLYCAAYGNGRFIVRGFSPGAFQMNGFLGEGNPAVRKAAGIGQPVTQEIALSVKGARVECSINGAVVASYNKAALITAGKLKSTDGIYGLRFAHNTEVTVTGLTIPKN